MLGGIAVALLGVVVADGGKSTTNVVVIGEIILVTSNGKAESMADIVDSDRDGGLAIIDRGNDSVRHGLEGAGVTELTHLPQVKVIWVVAESVT